MRLEEKIKEFKDKNVLLLQGPVGPFFYRFAKALKKQNAKVFKLNFNGGDKLFYPFGYDTYRGNFRSFRHFLKSYCLAKNIDCIVCYNDCRPLHVLAIKIAKRLNVQVYVFEEGYLRPNFITLEKDGVNANSRLSKDKNFYLNLKPSKPVEENIKNSFALMCFYGYLYWLFAFLLAPFYNNKLHHRSLNPFEFVFWLRSLYRNYLYKITQKKILQNLEGLEYFIGILQVHNDTQITKHYEGKSIECFIKDTVSCFAKNASSKHCLIFKHHPMDRGYKNYSKLIKELEKKHSLEGRLFYIDSCNLPLFLQKAYGCVLINSTVGLSALYHNCPIKCLGKAFYDIEGLSYQKSLDLFFKEARLFKPDQKLFTNFRAYLIHTNQINCSFYTKFNAF
ncbi:capsule polysaccharide modification protein KpsS [Campylobacter troglodytis]|uniref:capsule polysaccharide modification protein KpsS n=1 Tax=Campylobacter troglodytis TaxID=654363 RepID=UPI00115765DD|nr:capsular biosynthesis protein [Campylobacter troglodytis]TQR61645.1 capsule biosynthesis protein [Campylobacter troglodytis]